MTGTAAKLLAITFPDTLDTESVIHTVKEVVAMHGIPAILNSDRGCQFTSAEYKALMKGLQIRQSMDGKSRWADNIMIGRWFRSLKTEQIYPNEVSIAQGASEADWGLCSCLQRGKAA